MDAWTKLLPFCKTITWWRQSITKTQTIPKFQEHSPEMWDSFWDIVIEWWNYLQKISGYDVYVLKFWHKKTAVFTPQPSAGWIYPI